MVSDVYRAQVQLLVRTLPFVAEEDCFALKGGTAINLFIRNLPRLSVDIDLAYLPVGERAASLAAIEAALLRIRQRVLATVPYTFIQLMRTGDGDLTGLQVRKDGAQIKIEVTPVMRGSVYPAVARTVTPAVEEQYGFAEIPVVSFADLYAGKLVAALDRQHPRDLFDVRDLLRHEGIDDDLRRAFLVYLIASPKPMAEVLGKPAKNIEHEFNHAFVGMTDENVTLAELQGALVALKAAIIGRMPNDHRRLLLSVESGEPDWNLLGIDGVAALPAVAWKLQNIRGLDAARRAANVDELATVLKD